MGNISTAIVVGQELKKAKRHNFVPGAFVLGFIIVFFGSLLLWHGTIDKLDFRENAVEVESIVTRVFKKYPNSKNSRMKVEVKYNVPGSGVEYYETSLDREDNERYKPGDIIALCYNREKPHRAKFKADLEGSILPGALKTLFGIFIGFCLLAWSIINYSSWKNQGKDFE